MNIKTKIENEIEEKQKELDKLNNKLIELETKPIKKLEDYSNEEKCKFFDSLYYFVSNQLDYVINNDIPNNMEELYYEELLKIIYDSKKENEFFKWYNNFL